MLVQNIFNCSNSISPLTVKTEKRGSGLGLRCKKPKPPEKKDKPGAKEVSTRGIIEAETKKVLVKDFKRPKLSKMRGRSQKWWKKARKLRDTGKRVFIGLCYLHVLAIICLLLQHYIQPQFFSFPSTYSSFFIAYKQRKLFGIEVILIFRPTLGHYAFFKIASAAPGCLTSIDQ